jgi:integrase
MNFQSKFALSIQSMLDFKEQFGYSKSTHIPSLKNFDRFCAEFYPEEATLSEQIVLAWLEKRSSENSGGLKKRANTIRQFGLYLNYMEQPAYVLPAGYIGGRSSFVPYILSDEELSAFFRVIDNFPVGRFSPCRHLVLSIIFRLIYCCGLRPNEARLLKATDVDYENGRIMINGTKENRDRIVMMSDDVSSLCLRYDKIVRSIFPGRKYFFPSSKGEAYANNTLIHYFNKCWRMTFDYGENVKKPRIYDLRHRFATAVISDWTDEGKDVQSLLPHLSAYMGHSNLSATAYYIHLLPFNLVRSDALDWNRFSDLIPEVCVL